MSHKWPNGTTSEFFSPKEFDHHELMDTGFIGDLDQLRMRCGFGLIVTDDARDEADIRRIYADEIVKDESRGDPWGTSWPSDSSHLMIDGHLVRAVDLKPAHPKAGDTDDMNLEERQLRLTYEVTRMWREGRWKSLGLGIETGHWHVDDTPRLGSKRPSFWVAVSR